MASVDGSSSTGECSGRPVAQPLTTSPSTSPPAQDEFTNERLDCSRKTRNHKRPAQQISHGPPSPDGTSPSRITEAHPGAPARPVESVVEAPVRTAAAAETSSAGPYLTETA
ncbi:hypothetical protein Plec18170_006712 [Paecilomyces lecythidis]